MADPRNLQELADSLAAIAEMHRTVTMPAGEKPLTFSAYHMGARDAVLDARTTVLAMIADGREVIRTVHEYPKPESYTSYYTIERDDIGRSYIEAFGKSWRLADVIGRVQPIDIGKRVYLRDGVLSVENDQQRDERLARGTQGTE